jgi:TonB family protein
MSFIRFAILGSVLALSLPVVSAHDAVPPPSGQSAAQAQDSPPQPRPARIRVSADVAKAHLAYQVPPIYPPIAKVANIQGTVVLHIIIGLDGTITEAEYVSGPPLLAQSATDAVKQWRYKPTALNGEPLEVDTTVSITFSLSYTGNTKAVTPPPAPAPPPAEESPKSAATSTPSAAPVYPDTTDGLRQLLGQLVEAIQKGDTQETSRLLEIQSVPDPKNWFARTFGPGLGERAAELYAQAANDPSPKTLDSLRAAIRGGKLNVDVKRYEPPDESAPESTVRPLLRAMQTPGAVFVASIYKDLPFAWRFPGYFFYVNGNFRFVAYSTLRDIPGLLPGRLQIGGNVQAAQITHLVQPTYPLDAKKSHIQGTVVLHAVIGKDGKIASLQFVNGPLELKQAAMDAVQQWIYKPTLLEGIPVEVDTTISVVFALGNR